MKVKAKTGFGTAHGKIILIGEHSVVHNQPAIAIPFSSAKVDVQIEERPGGILIDSLYYQGDFSKSPHSLTNLVKTLEAVAHYLGEEVRNMKITVLSNIPPERGMGSSAAVATALVRALFDFFEAELTDELLERFVTISEEIAHGNPSGLDARVVRSEEALYFIRNQEPDAFDSRLPAYLVVADTGEKGETLHAVADVGKLVADETTNGRELVEELGAMTIAARKFIEENKVKELGEIMSKAQHNLRELTVSNDTLDRLIEVAMDNGALGSKLTGGGRGGCLISLTDHLATAEKLAAVLVDAGAEKTWIHPLGAVMNEK